MNRIIIYTILISLLFIGVKQYFHFSDYSLGMVQGILVLSSLSIFFIIFLVLFIVDLYQFIKFKKRIDFIPSLLLILFVALLSLGFSKLNKPFFWKKEFYKGKICYINSNDKIYLYENETCAFEIQHIENKEIVGGKFKIVNDTLMLTEYDTTEVNKIFTNRYFFAKDSSLIALDDKYLSIIKIE